MIMHIVGNRPQFIKLAALEQEIRKRGYEQIIVHTGQHYDKNMSDIFFDELQICKPTVNLGVGSGSHGQMTGKAIISIEQVIEEYRPKCVILYGDTDSTLAGAIATSKMDIPIIHVEAGVRTGSRNNPEEINRIVTDHISTLLFCADRMGVANLEKEGLKENAYFVGDLMFDTFINNRDRMESNTLCNYNLKRKEYVLMTWHRQENTSSANRMLQILDFIKKVDCNVICPLHPRTRKKLEEYSLDKVAQEIQNLRFIEPVGYLEMIELMVNSRMILTDSGGVSKESYFAGVKCIQMFDWTIWPDLEEINWIYKADFDNDLKGALEFINEGGMCNEEDCTDFYGDGTASVKIVDILEKENMI